MPSASEQIHRVFEPKWPRASYSRRPSVWDLIGLVSTRLVLKTESKRGEPWLDGAGHVGGAEVKGNQIREKKGGAKVRIWRRRRRR